ncbi:hypothetical protein ACFL11_00945 [Patescibacteria group bacterium]
MAQGWISPCFACVKEKGEAEAQKECPGCNTISIALSERNLAEQVTLGRA